MAISDTSRFQLRYAKESAWNVIPAVAFQNLTVTGESLAYNINTTVSGDIRSDRQITDLVQTSAESAGGISTEVRATALNDFFEGALFNTFTTSLTFSETDVSAAAADQSYNTVAGDFVADGIVAGQWILVSGFSTSGNNGYAKVVSVAVAKVIVTGLTIVNESAGNTILIKGSMLRDGTTNKSFTIEKEFVDITEFLWHSGCRIASMSLDVASGAIATADFDFLGADHDSQQTTKSTGSAVTAVSGQIMNGVSNVSNIREGGAPIAAGIFIQSLSINVDNGVASQNAIGSLAPVGIRKGRSTVTGEMTIYYSNDDMYSKFTDGTATAISYRLLDSLGNGYILTLPNVKFTTASVNAGSADSDVLVPLAYQALMDATLGFTIQIDKFTV